MIYNQPDMIWDNHMHLELVLDGHSNGKTIHTFKWVSPRQPRQTSDRLVTPKKMQKSWGRNQGGNIIYTILETQFFLSRGLL